MPQQEQQDFTESLEAAFSWMQATQERLRANDNTQGPRDALEARLRETEKIHHSQHEGHVKIDMVLVAAEHLLQSEDEELRNHTHSKLKDLKSQWEETSTYIIHCHSRIEWVWLHWSEYLKAYEEFELWLTRQQRSLAVSLELQLGVKEKLWQVDQQRVVVSDIHSQASLLERLLDEAGALHNRTQDPSVDAQAQERMQVDYNDVRDRAEERLLLLQKIAEEHQTYQGCVQRFQSWLLSKTKELTELMERDDPAENKLQALKALDDTVACEEKTLLHIESLSEGVRANTSPAGAEQVVEEAEELRLGWQRLRQGLCEAEEGLRASLDTHSQYVARCQRLGEDITRLQLLLQGLDQDLEEGRETGDRTDRTEEQMVGQWRTYTGVKNTLVGEESQVEHLKAQLKDLFRFSEDSRHLSDGVLAVVKEHQSVKCRASRLCSESESGLRSVLRDPLSIYTQWSHMVSQVLEAEVTDFSHIAMLVQNIERLLRDSVQLQERLSLLQVKGDLLDSVFGRERSDSLQTELSAAIRNRELLHTQLLQRKSRLQGLISRTKDFGDAYELIRSKLTSLRDRLVAGDALQPDILAKKSQSDQFRVIQKDLEDCEAHLTALETLVSSSPNNRTQFEKLYADWKNLYTVVRVKVHDSEVNIADHEGFHDCLLNIEKWLMIMKQKLESFHSSTGEWSIEGRQQEAEKALGEFPEKELQLQKTEAQGRCVLEKTSEDGRVHILRDMERLRAAWMSLYNMSLNLDRLLKFSTEQTEADSWKLKTLSTEDILVAENNQVKSGSATSSKGQQERSGDMYQTLAFSGSEQEGSLEMEFEEDDIIGTSSWVEGQSGGHFVPENKDGRMLSSMRTFDSGSSFVADEMDSPAWSLRKRKDQRVSKDLIVDGESNIDNSKVGESSSLSGDRDPAVVIASTTGGYSEAGGRRYWGEGGVEAADSLGHGGGAFVHFTRSPDTQEDKDSQISKEEFESKMRAFAEWLQKSNEELIEVLSSNPDDLSDKEQDIMNSKLTGLRSGVQHGEELFQLLLKDGCRYNDEEMEELRYRWMLYKSKLKQGYIKRPVVKAKLGQKRPVVKAKLEKKPSLLYRVCRLALPLWLLLLALLLLAFLLPLMDEGNSCSLSNNFARSFNIMLRYQGPPPT